MRNIQSFSYLSAMVLVAGSLLLPGTAGAANWSINIGVPVVAVAPAPVMVYSPPAPPVVTVAPVVPVVYPPVSGYVVQRHPAHYYYGERYHPHPRYHHDYR